jgi:hypothetical protein
MHETICYGGPGCEQRVELQRHSSHRQDRETPNPEATAPHSYGGARIGNPVQYNGRGFNLSVEQQ